MSEIIMVYITIFPCKSMYWWENAIQNDQEFIILAKTKESKFESLEQEITKIHPYQVPCILKIAATANIPYAQWLNKELDSSSD